MKSLYTKYRPSHFSEVIGQESIVKILKQQLETNNIFNCMIFSGVSGTGKTTLARIFANDLNNHIGVPIEIDAASNNGVDNIRNIIKSANEKSLLGEYKVFIIDEAHMLTVQAWNALLKTIEEPPKYTIFIFCTTDPLKIPETIQNRCMRFNFTRVPSELIKQRLDFICRSEGNILNWQDTIDYISRNCNGEVRRAISMLETCVRYDKDINIKNAILSLNIGYYEDYFDLINSIIDGNFKSVITIVDNIYDRGLDLKKFISMFTDFCLDILKYILCKDITVTRLPITLEEKIKYAIGFDKPEKYYIYITDKLLELNNLLNTTDNNKTTIEIFFNQLCRCVQ